MKCFSLCCSKRKKRKELVHIQWWCMPDNLANISWITLYNELKRLVSLSPFYTLGNGKLRERGIAANTWHLPLSPVVSKTEKSKHSFSFLPCPPHLIPRITPNTWEHAQLLLRCRQHNAGFLLPTPCRAGEGWLQVRFYAQGIELTSLLPPWRTLEVVLLLEGKKSLALPHS